jgi:hypothetical protein
MNYPVLGLGVFLMLMGGLLVGIEEVPEGSPLVLAVVGLALALYAVFFHGSGQKMTGGRRIKDNWV